MGAGRKTETYGPARPTQYQTDTRPYGNQCAPARNLRQDQLGGVIFGCTYKTFEECFSKKLFGLPSGHFLYVKNIKPGLPLFLFNFSNRKLHGIFEAVCPGQFEIDRFAWSTDGTTTQYPAQVRFSTKTQCLPLSEKMYKSVISENYRREQPGHIYFELDHRQTRDLIALFVPDPLRGIREKSSSSEPPASSLTVSNKWSRPLPFLTAKTDLVSGQMKIEPNDIVPHTSPNLNVDYGSTNRTSTSYLDEDASDHDDQVDGLTKRDTESVNDDQRSKMAVLQKLQELSFLRQKKASSEDAPVSISATLPKDSSNATSQCDAPVKNNTSFVQCHENAEMLQIINELSRKNETIEKKQAEADQEILSLKELVKGIERRVQQLEFQFQKLQLEHNFPATLGVTHNSVEGPSILLIGGYNGINWLSSLDSFCPAMDILEPLMPMRSVRAYAAVAALKDHVIVFGGGNASSSSWYNTVECYNRAGNRWTALPCLNHEKGSLAGASLNDKIFAIGGGDGSQYLSEVEMFDPAAGKWIYSPSMQQPRFGPAAAELNGVLYVVGGYDGSIYLQSAERFDPREGFWTQLPSMRARRGSHSVVVLGDSLYALGGYDGTTISSSVEVFDTHANSWRTDSPFNVPRAFGCAVVANGSAYLLGGIRRGGEYVQTVEVYNEGQGWSISGSSAVGKRVFASAIVA